MHEAYQKKKLKLLAVTKDPLSVVKEICLDIFRRNSERLLEMTVDPNNIPTLHSN